MSKYLMAVCAVILILVVLFCKIYYFGSHIFFVKDEINFSVKENNSQLILTINDWRKDRITIRSSYDIQDYDIFIELFATSRLIRTSGIREMNIPINGKGIYKIHYKNPDGTSNFIKEIEVK